MNTEHWTPECDHPGVIITCDIRRERRERRERRGNNGLERDPGRQPLSFYDAFRARGYNIID